MAETETRTAMTPMSYNTCMTHFITRNTTRNRNRKKGCLSFGIAMKKKILAAWPIWNLISLRCDHDGTHGKTIQFYI